VIIANDATKRVLDARERTEGERAFVRELQKAISSSLDHALAEQAKHVEALGLQSRAQFLQLVNLTRRSVVEKLDELLECTRKNPSSRGDG
jgi:L-lactate utilization protein LutB